jgi:hypothetical protein
MEDDFTDAISMIMFAMEKTINRMKMPSEEKGFIKRFIALNDDFNSFEVKTYLEEEVEKRTPLKIFEWGNDPLREWESNPMMEWGDSEEE